MKDLQHPRWMWLKAILFLVIGLVAGGLLIAESPHLRTVVFLGLVIWAFCRAYYFAFYVIQHYIEPGFRFSGLWSVVQHLLKRR